MHRSKASRSLRHLARRPGNWLSFGRIWRPGRGLVWLLVGLLVVFHPGSLPALDQGGFKPGISAYYSRFQNFGTSFTISELFPFIDFYQNLTNYGLLEGRLGYGWVRDTYTTQQYNVWAALRNHQLGRGLADFWAGDQYTSITRFPIFFSNTFYPPQYFRGFSTRYVHPAFEMELLGGTVTRSWGYYSETFRSLGEQLYGGVLRCQPWDRWSLETSFYQTFNEQGIDGQLATRRNSVYRVGSTLRTWKDLYLAGELMQSFNIQPNYQRVNDVAGRGGAIWQSDRLRLEGNYHYIGPNFHLINNLFFPDPNNKGYFLAGNANPWSWLSVFGSYNSALNNLVPQATSVVTETEFRSAGGRFYLPPWPMLYGMYYQSNVGTRGDFFTQVKGKNTGLYVDLSKRWQWLEPYARYQSFEFTNQIDAANSYRQQSPVAGVRGYHQKFTWYVEGEYDYYKPSYTGIGYDGFYSRLGGSYYVTDKLYLFGEVSYRPNSSKVGGQFGINYRMPKEFHLQAYGRIEQGTQGPGDFTNTFVSNQVTLQLTKAFNWGKKAQVAGVKPGQEWLGSGSIEGYVFNDENYNKVREPGESGVAGVTVKLADGTAVTTDEKGYYKFPAVAAGNNTVVLETRRIPAAYTFLGDETSTLNIQRRAQGRVDFPFVRGVSIKGQVLAVSSSPGKGERGLGDILVIAQPGNHNTYTDSEGSFTFTGLVPGTYEISLHPESLPEHATVTSPQTQTVDLSPGAAARNIRFRINAERRIIVLDKGGQNVPVSKQISPDVENDSSSPAPTNKKSKESSNRKKAKKQTPKEADQDVVKKRPKKTQTYSSRTTTKPDDGSNRSTKKKTRKVTSKESDRDVVKKRSKKSPSLTSLSKPGPRKDQTVARRDSGRLYSD